jgi:hypothetical protein
MNKREEKFWSKALIGQGCWKWTGGTNDMGYGRFYHKGKYTAAGKVAWELTNGPIPTGAAIRHTCKEPLCVRPGHLKVDLRLTESDVLRMRKLLGQGCDCGELAEEFSVSLNTVYDIRSGRTWKRLPNS